MTLVESNEIKQFTAGDTTYVADLNTNFETLRAAVNQLSDTQKNVNAANNPVNAADAVSNLENVCCNGFFSMGLCRGDLNLLSAMPRDNINYGVRRIEDVDAWFFKPDHFESTAGEYSIEVTRNSDFELVVEPGNINSGFTGGLTGSIFQRLDYFWPIHELRGRPFVFAVRYTATTDDEFYLEVDDGVTVTNTLLAPGGPSPAIQNTVFVSHGVSTTATKLTVKIVLLKDAVAGAPALRISECYGRFGSGIPVLPAGVSPSVMARDLTCARMLSRAFVWGAAAREVCWSAMVAVGGADCYQEELFMDIPLMVLSMNDVVEEVEIDASTTDPSSLLDPAVTVTQELTGDLEWSDKTMIQSALIKAERPAGGPVLPAGFVADQVDWRICVIPDA